jgi:hypothetical protein
MGIHQKSITLRNMASLATSGNTNSPSMGNTNSPSMGNTNSPSMGNTNSPSMGNTNSPSMGNTNQVTKEEVDNLLLDIHTQRDTMCSIGQTVFKDPVDTTDGQTYERNQIQTWFNNGHNTSPKTGTILHDLTLTPNTEKKAQVEAIEALRPFVKTVLEDRKKVERLEIFLEAKEKKEKEYKKKAEEAEEERKQKEAAAAAAVEEERKQKEAATAAERKRKEADKKERQKAIQEEQLRDIQILRRSIGLA